MHLCKKSTILGLDEFKSEFTFKVLGCSRPVFGLLTSTKTTTNSEGEYMSEMNARFEEFIRSLRPSDGQLTLAKDELDFIEKKFSTYDTETHDDFSYKKSLRSGSYAKDAILKRHDTGDFDADIGIYFDVEDAETLSPHDLMNHVESVLRRAYKNRTERTPEFERAKSAVRVKFETHPKINIDAVPIVSLEHASIENYGYIPRRDNEKRKTSVTEHVKFVTDRNKQFQATPFNQILMLWKWWRNNAFEGQQRDQVSSFFLELVVAKAFDETYKTFNGDWLSNLLKMGTWIVRQRLREPVYFVDKRIPVTAIPKDPVVVLDSVNPQNNVAASWSVQDRDRFVNQVQNFCDVLNDAINEAVAGDDESAVEVLDAVFPNFSTWSVE